MINSNCVNVSRLACHNLDNHYALHCLLPVCHCLLYSRLVQQQLLQPALPRNAAISATPAHTCILYLHPAAHCVFLVRCKADHMQNKKQMMKCVPQSVRKGVQN